MDGGIIQPNNDLHFLIITMNVCTINTDASHCNRLNVGTYAYWIRCGNWFVRGGGVFKDSVKGSTQAEFMSVVNALHIVDKFCQVKIDRIIFNRDNVRVLSKKKGNELERKIAGYITRIRRKNITHLTDNKFIEFRHVKSHKNDGSKKAYVNEWCDKRCKMELRNYRASLAAEKINLEVS